MTGLYLKLLHGRHQPGQDMDDMGFEGPEIGPLKSVHGTYTTHLMLSFVEEADAVKFGIDPAFPVINYEDDMLIHRMPDGDFAWYGDWTTYQQGGDK